MAEDDDEDSKTEDPTEKKLRDALEKGNVPTSREAPLFATALGFYLYAVFFLPDAIGRLGQTLKDIFERPDQWYLGTAVDVGLTRIAATEAKHLFQQRFIPPPAAFSDPQVIFVKFSEILNKMMIIVVMATALLATVDVFWTRYHWYEQLRMTKQEVKDEHKQAEGDPILKSRRLSLARDRARNRMMAAVPRATVIIANPTHYAVALRYVQEEGGAPLVLAKGTDLIALKIREIAEANDIPVVEDRALARSLHAAVQLDQMIPPEFYKVVAELLCLVYAKKVA